MEEVSGFEVIFSWVIGLGLSFLVISAVLSMLPGLISAPTIKPFFEGPQAYLILILFEPVIRRLFYLREYPGFVRENIDELVENPSKLDDEFQRRFIRLDFREAILIPIIPAILQTIMVGSTIWAFIFPWMFYLFGEFFFFAFFICIVKIFGQYAIPKTLFILHLVGKPVSGPSQNSKPKHR